MKRSSSDNPPRVGMVVRFARQADGSPVSCFANETINEEWATTKYWNRGQYDIISEPTEVSPYTATSSQTPCNCPQSLALVEAMRRIVATMDGFPPANARRSVIDLLTEVNLIAQEALKWAIRR